MWDNIYQPDQTGSEGGLIIADEEYRDSLIKILLMKKKLSFMIGLQANID